VGTPLVIVGQVAGKASPEVPFVENHNVIKEFSANAADHTLGVRILPR
jgi:hypothetical protein